MKLIDVVCSQGHVAVDVFVKVLTELPVCKKCGAETERAWLSAPSITPQGTRAEINTDRFKPKKIDTKAIAAEVTQEVEQKWLRYSDEKIAEQHVSREINEKAGIADAMGNPTPLPTPAPITFAKPAEAYA